MDDQELNEKFRVTTMHLERLEGELKLLRLGISNAETKLERVRDELILPSGILSRHFSELEKQIQQIQPNSSC